MKKYIIWGAGFAILLLINLIVEWLLLSLWGLDNTDKNDIYFICWWAAVGIWFFFGLIFLQYLNQRKENRSISTT